METLLSSYTIGAMESSYPTYEEWKRIKAVFPIPGLAASSYPTYEEWKLFKGRDYLPIFYCSYPTYEEWKLGITFEIF